MIATNDKLIEREVSPSEIEDSVSPIRVLMNLGSKVVLTHNKGSVLGQFESKMYDFLWSSDEITPRKYFNKMRDVSREVTKDSYIQRVLLTSFSPSHKDIGDLREFGDLVWKRVNEVYCYDGSVSLVD